jgi:murein DD-endopeptidase MepM/ murein hydrolase activator NlpD
VLAQLRPEHEEPELITVTHSVKAGETLYRIARAYEISVEELMAANGIDEPRSLDVGHELLIPGASELREVPPLEARVPPVRAPPPPRKHVVQAGETLYRIAKAYEVSVDELMQANGLRDARELAMGQELLVPARPGREAGVERIPEGPDGPRGARAGLHIPEFGAKAEGAAKGALDWPLRGVLYARFGKKSGDPHDGIDLAAPAGTPVKTAAEGQVLYAGEQRGYGNIVIIEHPGGLVTVYAHNRDVRVNSGQKVRRGQVVATVGESGRTSGPHLHFEVRKDAVPVDPMHYLGPIPRE